MSISLYPLLFALLLSCPAPVSNRSSKDNSQADLRTASLAAFDEHVRPALNLCASCHGNAQAPLFMVEDTEIAHDAAVSNVDFDDLDKSHFLKRIIEQKHNCGDCEATGELVRAALSKWQEARAATGAGNELGTVTQQLSFPSHPDTMQYDIGTLIAKEYAGNIIRLSVKVIPDNESYSLVNLSVFTDNIDIYIKGIKPLINGKHNSKEDSYNDIACAVKSTEERRTGHIIHATGASIVPDDFSAKNKLSFGIAEIRLARDDDPSCWNDDIHKDVFTDSIRPIIADNCEGAGCHGTVNPVAGGDILSNYQDVMSKPNIIIGYLKGENESHKEGLSGLDEDDKQQFLNWLREDE